MRRVFLIALAVVCVASAGRAEDKKTARSTPLVVRARVVEDAASLSPQDWSGTSSWLVASIQPSARGSWGTVEGGVFRDGVLVAPPGARAVSMVEGTIAVLGTVSGKSPGAIKYQFVWPENRGIWENKCGFSPFRGLGGTAVLRYSQNSVDGLDGFTPCFMIPDEWAESVVAGAAYWQEHRDILGEPKQHAKECHALVTDKNPVVQIVALRMLAKAGQLSEEDAKAVLQSNNPGTISAGAYLLVRYVESLGSDSLNAIVDERVSATRDAAVLRAYAVGGYVAGADSPQGEFNPVARHLVRGVGEQYVKMVKDKVPMADDDRQTIETILSFSSKTTTAPGATKR